VRTGSLPARASNIPTIKKIGPSTPARGVPAECEQGADLQLGRCLQRAPGAPPLAAAQRATNANQWRSVLDRVP